MKENRNKYAGVSSEQMKGGNAGFGGSESNGGSNFYNANKITPTYPGNNSSSSKYQDTTASGYQEHSTAESSPYGRSSNLTLTSDHSSANASPAKPAPPKVVEQNLLDFDAPTSNSKPNAFADFSGFQSAPAPKSQASQPGFENLNAFQSAPAPASSNNNDFGDFTDFQVAPAPAQTQSQPQFAAFSAPVSKPQSSNGFGDFTSFQSSQPKPATQFAAFPTTFPNATSSPAYPVSTQPYQQQFNSPINHTPTAFGDFTGAQNLLHSPPKATPAQLDQKPRDPFAQLVALDAMSLSGPGKKEEKGGPSLNTLGSNNVGYQPRQF
jgi:Tfp pilus assembly protein PilV